MFKGLIELVDLILFYISFHLIALMVLIGFMVYVIQGNDSPQIIHQIPPSPVTILETSEVCTRIGGCPIVEGICQGCQTVQKEKVILQK